MNLFNKLKSLFSKKTKEPPALQKTGAREPVKPPEAVVMPTTPLPDKVLAQSVFKTGHLERGNIAASFLQPVITREVTKTLSDKDWLARKKRMYTSRHSRQVNRVP